MRRSKGGGGVSYHGAARVAANLARHLVGCSWGAVVLDSEAESGAPCPSIALNAVSQANFRNLFAPGGKGARRGRGFVRRLKHQQMSPPRSTTCPLLHFPKWPTDRQRYLSHTPHPQVLSDTPARGCGGALLARHRCAGYVGKCSSGRRPRTQPCTHGHNPGKRS